MQEKDLINHPLQIQKKPDYLRPIFANFPEELTELDQWVVWKARYDKDREKWTKPLHNPKTGGYAKSNVPETWGTFEQASGDYKYYCLTYIRICYKEGFFIKIKKRHFIKIQS